MSIIVLDAGAKLPQAFLLAYCIAVVESMAGKNCQR